MIYADSPAAYVTAMCPVLRVYAAAETGECGWLAPVAHKHRRWLPPFDMRAHIPIALTNGRVRTIVMRSAIWQVLCFLKLLQPVDAALVRSDSDDSGPDNAEGVCQSRAYGPLADGALTPAGDANGGGSAHACVREACDCSGVHAGTGGECDRIVWAFVAWPPYMHRVLIAALADGSSAAGDAAPHPFAVRPPAVSPHARYVGPLNISVLDALAPLIQNGQRALLLDADDRALFEWTRASENGATVSRLYMVMWHLAQRCPRNPNVHQVRWAVHTARRSEDTSPPSPSHFFAAPHDSEGEGEGEGEGVNSPGDSGSDGRYHGARDGESEESTPAPAAYAAASPHALSAAAASPPLPCPLTDPALASRPRRARAKRRREGPRVSHRTPGTGAGASNRPGGMDTSAKKRPRAGCQAEGTRDASEREQPEAPSATLARAAAPVPSPAAYSGTLRAITHRNSALLCRAACAAPSRPPLSPLRPSPQGEWAPPPDTSTASDVDPDGRNERGDAAAAGISACCSLLPLLPSLFPLPDPVPALLDGAQDDKEDEDSTGARVPTAYESTPQECRLVPVDSRLLTDALGAALSNAHNAARQATCSEAEAQRVDDIFLYLVTDIGNRLHAILGAF